MEELIRKKTGLREVEEFVIKERKTFHNMGEEGNNSRVQRYRDERRIVVQLMSRKLKGNNQLCTKLRKEKYIADKELVAALGGKTREYRGIVKDTRKNSDKLKEDLKKKNMKKVDWLVRKYEHKYDMSVDMTEDEYEKYGMSEILSMECTITADELREPEIVQGKGETLEISEDEKKVLALGPKFCVRKALKDEDFEIELEECIAKIKGG